MRGREEKLKRLAWFLFCLSLALALSGCGSKPKSEGPPKKPALEEAPDPAAAVAVDLRPAIVALGNSLTAGLGVDPAENYPARLQARLDAEGYRYRVLNMGVSGDTSAQGLGRLEAVREARPEIAIVELGANDGLRGMPVDSTRSNLETIIRGLQSDGVKVILAGMKVPPNYGLQYTSVFRDLFSELAEQYKIQLIPFFLEGVAGRFNLNQEDGIHPTAKGYEIVTENVWKVLKGLLRKS